MRTSKRSAPAIAVLLAAGLATPAMAAPDVPRPSPIFPPPAPCKVAPPVAGTIKFSVTPQTIRQGTQPRLRFAIVNGGKTCLGVPPVPYGLQQSGFAGWSDIPWDTGFHPQIVRYLRPGEAIKGITAPVPATLSAGGYYRLIPKFSPDAKEPVAGALITVR